MGVVTGLAYRMGSGFSKYVQEQKVSAAANRSKALVFFEDLIFMKREFMMTPLR